MANRSPQFGLVRRASSVSRQATTVRHWRALPGKPQIKSFWQQPIEPRCCGLRLNSCELQYSVYRPGRNNIKGSQIVHPRKNSCSLPMISRRKLIIKRVEVLSRVLKRSVQAGFRQSKPAAQTIITTAINGKKTEKQRKAFIALSKPGSRNNGQRHAQ